MTNSNSPVIQLAKRLKKEDTMWERFRKCNAYISYLIEGRYRLIKSYSTIVGVADYETHIVYEIGKYSATTRRQFTEICESIFHTFDRQYIGGRV